MLTEQPEREGAGEDPGYDPFDDPPMSEDAVYSKDVLLKQMEKLHDDSALFRHLKREYERRYGNKG